MGYLDIYNILSILLMQQLGPASAEAVGEIERPLPQRMDGS